MSGAFTCGFPGCFFLHSRLSVSVSRPSGGWGADFARFRELDGDPRVTRLDNAPVNVSRAAENFGVARAIRTGRICPCDSHQPGQAEQMNGTTFSGARTALLASSLEAGGTVPLCIRRCLDISNTLLQHALDLTSSYLESSLMHLISKNSVV